MNFVAMHFEENGNKLTLIKFRNTRRTWRRIEISYDSERASIWQTNRLLRKVTSFVGDLPVFCCYAKEKQEKIYNAFIRPFFFYNLKYPNAKSKSINFNFYDINDIAKKILPDIKNTKIKTLVKYFNISYDPKSTLSFLTAIGTIVNKLVKLNSTDSSILSSTACYSVRFKEMELNHAYLYQPFTPNAYDSFTASFHCI